MRRIFFGILLTMLVASGFTATFNVEEARSSPTTITVPDDFPTIQQATDYASSGDTIYVRKGTYVENIIIRKPVSLIGEDRTQTIIDGSNLDDSIKVQANNVVIRGFTVQHGYFYGINIWDYHNTTVTDNILIQNGLGVMIANSQNNTITNNTISDNSAYGIMIGGMPCRFNVIASNQFEGNGHTIDIMGPVLGPNIIRDNTINASTVLGMWINNGHQTMVYGNTITNSAEVGIRVSSSSDVLIYENNITANAYYGILVYSSTNTSVYLNNFFDNTPAQAYVPDTTVSWDNGRRGNYWNDYSGIDSDADGIGDTPYNITENNRDRYPLIIPWNGTIVEDHDIAITNLTISKHIVNNNYNVRVKFAAENQGTTKERFNATIYANTSIIATFQDVTIQDGNSTTLTFDWNITSAIKGCYMIDVIASPVQGETDNSDNALSGMIFVSILGDVDADFDVDIFDLISIATAYGTAPPNPFYKPNLDMNSDNIIDLFDILITATHFGEGD